MTEKEQLWYARFLDYANSGISQQRWCRDHGIPQSTFRYWCNKFNAFRIDDEPQDVAAEPGQWYEICCQPETTPAGDYPTPAERPDSIRLQIQELKMEFPAGTDSRMILRIAKGLMRS